MSDTKVQVDGLHVEGGLAPGRIYSITRGSYEQRQTEGIQQSHAMKLVLEAVPYYQDEGTSCAREEM